MHPAAVLALECRWDEQALACLDGLHVVQVSVRAEARAVGLRVLRRAAAERAREEAAAKERRLVSMQLHNPGEASQASAPAAAPKGCCPSLKAYPDAFQGRSSETSIHRDVAKFLLP